MAWYRGRYVYHQLARDASIPDWRSPRNCADARWLADVWAERSFRARILTQRWKHQQALLLTDSEAVIRHVFGPYSAQAIAVAKCESGWSMTPHAHNGQYLGMFQMGSYARAAYGHGEDRLTQARAAYRYFIASGRDWSPWSCRP